MKNIALIGVGYVGLVSGACFADLGNKVTCVDINERRIANLNKGVMPIFEPGLEELVRRNTKAGRLFFTTSYEETLKDADFAFIAVGTPSDVDGQADLRYVRLAAESIADVIDHYLIIVNKSTVPVGTGDWVAEIIRMRRPDVPDFDVVSCPEFLREGSAISDFMNPDRVILGSTNRDAAEKVAQLHLPLRTTIMITDLRTAEMVKYASNAFLAAKISFINEIANICEALGADVKEVAYGMGLDDRIGHAFLDAGLGWGGSCFPKDVKALASMAEIEGRHPHLLHAVMDINRDQRYAPLRKAERLLGHDLRGKVIGILGLAFKPNTDDMRDAPSIDIIRNFQRRGALVRAYD
ncbi:MAG TPA: UDP-glucose/GDP-mannose dehydrogenase family protein, partial [Chloroflexi bacterium]|nr:UDP-glucose/GDP-mannose dehydrogenase family protein [Chloroflexota bacterium]